MNSIEKILKQKNVLEFISSAKPKYKRNIIKTSDNKLIHVICEACENILHGNLPISVEDKTKLKKYKSKIRKLASKSSIDHKKHILGQKGGFLNILIPAIVSGISTIIGSFIESTTHTNNEIQ